MTTTVFFDLDGTLTDPMPGITRSIQYALKRLNVEAPAADELTWCIGPPLHHSLCELVGEELAPQALEYYRERFSDVGLFENTLYMGVTEALAALSNAGLTLYVTSSKPIVFVERIVDHFRLRNYFAGIYGSELDGTRGDKAELLRYVLSITQATPTRCTMIGDRRHDIVAAIQNDVKSIGVLYGYGSAEELRHAGAELLAHKPSDLVHMLL